MGMYTAFHIGVELKQDTPENVIKILQMMADKTHTINEDDFNNNLPEHPFFQCPRWKWLFKMDSYSFSYKSHWDFSFDNIGQAWYLSVTSNLKNYSNEIEHFFDWIKSYLEEAKGEMIGYSRYENDDSPTIYHAS